MKYPAFVIQHRYAVVLLCVLVLLFVNTRLYAQQNRHPSTHQEVAQQPAIVFLENSWKAALKQAAETNKYIFVDAYASWCAPCKLLKSTTFRDKAAAAFFNEHFVNLSIDMEIGEGIDLANQWNIIAYPTLVIFDSKGKPVLQSTGYIKPAMLIEFGKQALAKKL